MRALDFEDFFLREYPRVVRALILALADRARAEDAAQEGFSRAFVSWTRVRAMDRPSAWVYVVALRHEQRRHRRVMSAPKLLPDAANVADPVSVATERAATYALLHALTARQRQVVVLRFYADLSLEEIASALGCRVGTIKATLHQALTVLRNSASEASDVRP
jgi:RNA polymerase sigma factor (sigma-70 family)